MTFAAAYITAGRPYPEVTVAVLPSSLFLVISIALVFSTYLHVSVLGTGLLYRNAERFFLTPELYDPLHFRSDYYRNSPLPSKRIFLQ